MPVPRINDWSYPNPENGPYIYTSYFGVETQYVQPSAPPNEGLDELLISQGHKGPPYRTGGPFKVYKRGVEYVIAPVSYHYKSGGKLAYDWDGYYWCPITSSEAYFVGEPVDLTTTMFGQGATSIARFKPGAAEVNLGQFIVELRELPRLLLQLKDAVKFLDRFTPGEKLWKHSERPIRYGNQAGSSYLGYTFGVRPILSDLRAVYVLQQHLEKKLLQLRRDNGRMVRRTGTTYDETDVNTTVVKNYNVGISPQLFLVSASGNRVTIQKTKEKYWFSGRFRYFIPNIHTDGWRKETIGRLYGLNVSPKLLWDVYPWTWLVDWFFNVGDIIDNMSTNAAENLVMDYGYQMGHRLTETQTSMTFRSKGIGPDGSQNMSISNRRYAETKGRIAAFPYGFGANPGTLSTRQLAILSALGLSRWG